MAVNAQQVFRDSLVALRIRCFEPPGSHPGARSHRIDCERFKPQSGPMSHVRIARLSESILASLTVRIGPALDCHRLPRLGALSDSFTLLTICVSYNIAESTKNVSNMFVYYFSRLRIGRYRYPVAMKYSQSWRYWHPCLDIYDSLGSIFCI